MPLLLEFLGAVLRFALTGIGAWLVAKGVITPEQAARFTDAAVAGGALMLVSLGWSLWAKYRTRLKFLGALKLPAGASEEQAKEIGTLPSVKADAFKTV